MFPVSRSQDILHLNRLNSFIVIRGLPWAYSADTHGYPHIRKSRYRDIQISRYPDIQIARYPDIHISRYPGIYGIQISRVSKYSDIQISRYPDIQVSRYPELGTLEWITLNPNYLIRIPTVETFNFSP